MSTESIFQLAMASVFVLFAAPAFGKGPVRQTLNVGLTDPVVLDLAVAAGDVRVAYSRDGELAVRCLSSRHQGEGNLGGVFGARHDCGTTRTAHPDPQHSRPVRRSCAKVSYQIDVPFRTDVNAAILGTGNLTVIGITGPAILTTAEGNIEVAAYRKQCAASFSFSEEFSKDSF